MSFLGNIAGLAKGVVDIVYPKTCIICKQTLAASSIDNCVCFACWKKIKRNLPPFCHRCGRQLKTPYFAKNICAGCLKKRLHFDRAFCPCVYDGVVKELIHNFKYKNKDYLGMTLSKLMVAFIEEYNIPMDVIDFIIPVALHKTKLREREFNQAQILSNHIARQFNKKSLDTILIRNRYTKTQTDLELSERYANVKGSFSAKETQCLKGKNILLIDDVMTTGATASEATFALKNAGAHIVFVLTLAN